MAASLKVIGTSSQAICYYIESAKHDDYYAKEFDESGAATKVDPPGYWYDKHGVFLGIVEHNSVVNPEKWVSLCRGIDPESNLPLSDKNRALKENGKEIEVTRTGLDITFTPHKSVSVLWGLAKALGREDIADTVARIEREAVEKTIDFIQEKYLRTRLRDGEIQVAIPAKAAVAIWQHSASRDGDMNLHHHTVWNNTVMAENGSMMSMEPSMIFKYQKAFASYYHVAACEGFNKAGINTKLREGENVFSIDGIEKELCLVFSKATERINSTVGEDASKAMRRFGNVSSRPNKKDEPLDEMLIRWKDEAAEYGFDEKILNDIFEKKVFVDISEEEKEESVQELTEILMDKVSCASDIDIEFEAGLQIQKRGGSLVSYENVWATAKSKMEIVSGEERDDKDELVYYSTKDVISMEKECLDIANSKRSDRFNVDNDLLNRILQEATTDGASQEQIDVIKNTITKDGLVINIEGVAGAGKSFSLKFIAKYYQEIGCDVYATSQQAKVKNDLAQSIGADKSATLESLRRKIAIGINPFSKGDVIIVDEAGMAGHKYFYPLLKSAQEVGAILINSGDSRQILTLNGGNLFGTFCEYLGSEKIEEVRRQGQHVISNPEEYKKFEWMRKATMQLSKAECDKALQQYAENGCIKILEGDVRRMEEVAIQEWMDGFNEDKSIAILASTNDSVYRMNQLARQELYKKGMIGDDRITVKSSCGSGTKETSFAIGDVVIFRKNDRNIGVFDADGRDDTESITNRRSGTITNIEDGIFTIELGDGKFVSISKDNYWDQDNDCFPIQHGYAMTVYSSQGISVNKSIVVDPSKFDMRLLYVSLSRHKKDISIYYSKEELTSIFNSMNEKGAWKKSKDMSDVELFHAASKANMRVTKKLTTADLRMYDGYEFSDVVKAKIKDEEKRISVFENLLNAQSKMAADALKEAKKCSISSAIAKDNLLASQNEVKRQIRKMMGATENCEEILYKLHRVNFFNGSFRGVLDGIDDTGEVFVAGNKIESAIYYSKYDSKRSVACISSLKYNSLENFKKITLVGSATVKDLLARCPGVRVANPGYTKSAIRKEWYEGTLPREVVEKQFHVGLHNFTVNKTYFYKKIDTTRDFNDQTTVKQRGVDNLDRLQIVASPLERRTVDGSFAPKILLASEIKEIDLDFIKEKGPEIFEVSTNVSNDVVSLLKEHNFVVRLMNLSDMAYVNSGSDDNAAIAAKFEGRFADNKMGHLIIGTEPELYMVHDEMVAIDINRNLGCSVVVKSNGWEEDDNVLLSISRANFIFNEEVQCCDETKSEFEIRRSSERKILDVYKNKHIVNIPTRLSADARNTAAEVGEYLKYRSQMDLKREEENSNGRSM